HLIERQVELDTPHHQGRARGSRRLDTNALAGATRWLCVRRKTVATGPERRHRHPPQESAL
ncbi:hypothetical protein, partial [Streptomyces tateyamensis]|uniref:hypothetical protein n=1 Tax=Streptomyces tateyamensis TaxID=565073 RepID=UPI001C64B31E